jgi:XRE family aerobic/anaerobic benzoate catabolism transcriptional regulator
MDAPERIDLLSLVGGRVRAAREARRLTRAELARQSGLSMRFLAQLEAGEANISLLRLGDVAGALDETLPRLVASGLRGRIDALLGQRSEVELDEVADWLAARFGTATGPLVALLGLRGAGKSSVGAALAKRLHVEFFELDALIERAAGLSLEQIFELQGPGQYRALERAALVRFLAKTSSGVLATGGGLVAEPETFALLQRRCTTVWLRATPEEHFQRVVQQGDRRPMAGNPAAMQELRALLAAREPLYARADVIVDTSGRTVETIAQELLAVMQAA